MSASAVLGILEYGCWQVCFCLPYFLSLIYLKSISQLFILSWCFPGKFLMGSSSSQNPSSSHFECFSLGKEYDKLEPLTTLISSSESRGRCILLAPPPFLPHIWCALAPHYLPLVSGSHRIVTPRAPSQWCPSSPFCSESTPTLSTYHHVLYTAFYFFILFIFCLSCQNTRARQVAPFGLVCALIFPSIHCSV